MNRHVVLALAGILALCGPRVAGAQNLLANGGFDGDLSGWTLRGGIGSWTAAWDGFDAGNDIVSGSARLEFSETHYAAADLLSQCVAVTAGDDYVFAGQMLIAKNSPPARLALRVFWSSHADCSTEDSGHEFDTALQDVLVFYQAILAAPPGAVAARVSLQIGRTSLVTPVVGRFDTVYFGPATTIPCTPSFFTMCLDDQPGDKRFEVYVEYSTTQGGGFSGIAVPVPLNAQGVRRGGVLWFFEPDNPEMLIKVLEGCGTNGHYWVFYSVGTNVHFTVNVRDTRTGQVWTRSNPDVHAAPPVQDTKAFPCAGG